MYYRNLGKSNIEVSEIGFGAWAIGGDAWGPVQDENSIAAMEKTLDLGINFIDTPQMFMEKDTVKLLLLK